MTVPCGTARQERISEDHTGEACGHEGGRRQTRRDRRGGDGPARIAAEGAGQGQRRRRQRRDDGQVQVARDRGADRSRERDPPRPRVGPAGVEAAREGRGPAFARRLQDRGARCAGPPVLSRRDRRRPRRRAWRLEPVRRPSPRRQGARVRPRPLADGRDRGRRFPAGRLPRAGDPRPAAC